MWKSINTGLIQFHSVWLMFKFIVLTTYALVVTTENAGSLFVLWMHRTTVEMFSSKPLESFTLLETSCMSCIYIYTLKFLNCSPHV